MNDEQILTIRLVQTSKIGPATFWQLWDNLKNLQAMVDWLQKNGHSVPSREEAEKHMRYHESHGIRVIHFSDPYFPELLRHIVSCPPVLYCKGQMNLLDRPIVGIVGARGASTPMVHFIKRLATDLGKAGFVVSSGLAAGIDTAAHLGALTTGTIGICAGGIDQIYPQQNTQLYKDVGLLISEMPLGIKPTSYLFPRRNRIIAGLSLGVVVAEAGFQSGSLITGQYAVEFNREVFVVPGSPLDPRSRGGNKLIKEGAILIESAEDILRFLRHKKAELFQQPETPIPTTPPDNLQSLILASLSHIPTPLDLICQQLDAPLPIINQELSRLEIKGLIIRNPNGHVILKK